MIVVSWPLYDEALTPAREEWRLVSRPFYSESVFTGSVRTYDVPFAKWAVSMRLPAGPDDWYGKRIGLLTMLKGRQGRVRLYHHPALEPAGTMRGLPVLGAEAKQFADKLTIAPTNAAADTLKIGDMIRVGSQMFCCTTDSFQVGSMIEVYVSPRVRATLPAATAVEWDAPSALFMLAGEMPYVPYERGHTPSITLDFIEDWT